MKKALFRFLCQAAFRKFESGSRDLELSQRKAWQRIQKRLKESPYWNERGMAACDLEQFPLTTYEDYRAELRGTLDHLISPLNGEKIVYWAESSGTSKEPKLFPITTTFKKEFQATSPAFLHGILERHPNFLQGRVLYLAATRGTLLPSGIEKGAISSLNFRSIPAWMRSFYAFGPELLENNEIFFSRGAELALAADLSAIVAITPEMILTFTGKVRQILQNDLQKILRDSTIVLSHSRREYLLSIAGKKDLLLKDIWPKLNTVVCWKTSTCGLQLPRLVRELGPGVDVADAIYSATEGWFNVPLSDTQPGGPLYPHGHVFEFLPVGARKEPSSLLRPWELKPGGEYELVITTGMGLVRYQMEDIVRCDGFMSSSPSSNPWISFVQKSSGFISLGHTRIAEKDLQESLGVASSRLSGKMIFAPNPSGNGLILHCEDLATVSPELLAHIDRSLAEKNIEYLDDLQRGLLMPLVARSCKDRSLFEAPKSAQGKSKLLLHEPIL